MVYYVRPSFRMAPRTYPIATPVHKRARTLHPITEGSSTCTNTLATSQTRFYVKKDLCAKRNANLQATKYHVIWMKHVDTWWFLLTCIGLPDSVQAV